MQSDDRGRTAMTEDAERWVRFAKAPSPPMDDETFFSSGVPSPLREIRKPLCRTWLRLLPFNRNHRSHMRFSPTPTFS